MNAIVFDLFETLITEWGHTKYTTRRIAADLCINYEDYRREWSALLQERYIGDYAGTATVIKYILSELKLNIDEALIEETAAKRDACKAECFTAIQKPILDMLSYLKEKGYKLGLISNCSTEEIAGFYNSDLTDFFDAVVFSCDVQMTKPNIDIYNHCLTLLHEKPSDCIFVGDGGSNELEGAKNAGMLPLKALWFSKQFNADCDLDKSFPVFYEPMDIIEYLEKNK